MNRKNIVFYFSDQQRWDTVNDTLTPNLMKLAREGVKFDNNFTCQPVCGPARACIQTGRYASRCGCFRNGIPLPHNIRTLAEYFNEAGYQTAYIGKWHLASGKGYHFGKTAVPKERQGGYSYWRAADILEFTSHGYDGYIFDEEGNKLDFKGYRADCINDFALEFLDKRDTSKPFFMFVSQLEPHHQNDRRRYEGYRETVEKFRDYSIPPDLSFLDGDYDEMYPDYLSAINRLDYNVGRLTDKLKSLGIYDDTIIVYTSDHGSHFRTRNAEYKRSCHDSCTHTPLIIRGGAFEGGKTETTLTSLIDIPPTLLSAAGIDIPAEYDGMDLALDKKRDCVFMQISEASNSRSVRTLKYKYEVRDPAPAGRLHSKSPLYFESYLYDLENDPYEKNNLIKSPGLSAVRKNLRDMLIKQMEAAGEKKPLILPAVIKRNK